MRTAIAALLACLALGTTGCTTYAQSKGVARTGGYTVLAGLGAFALGAAYVAARPIEREDYRLYAIGAVSLFPVSTGALLGVLGLAGMVHHGERERVEAENARARAVAAADDEVQERADAQAETMMTARRHEIALVLARRGTSAARAGACSMVRTIDVQVRALDAEVHATLFLAEATVRGCLEAIAAPPVVEPTAAK